MQEQKPGTRQRVVVRVSQEAPGNHPGKIEDRVVVVEIARPGVVRVYRERALKGSGAVGPQVVLDTPRMQQDVGQPFELAGWAADLSACQGTGIATLHACA